MRFLKTTGVFLLSVICVNARAEYSFDVGTGTGFFDRGDVVSRIGQENVPNDSVSVNFKFLDTVSVVIECSKDKRGGGGPTSTITKTWDRDLAIDSQFQTVVKRSARGVSQTVTRWTFSGYLNPYRIPRGFCNQYYQVDSGWSEKTCTATPSVTGTLYFMDLVKPAAYPLLSALAPSTNCLPQ